MSKRQTYGESMSKWERDRDEADWERRLFIAKNANNPEVIKRLIEEAKSEGYSISKDVLELLKE